MARNYCYDILRKQQGEKLPQDLPLFEGQYAYIERISLLEQKDQEIVTLKVLSGMTCREIGKVMGMTAPAVQKRYQRAMQKLKEQEESYGE